MRHQLHPIWLLGAGAALHGLVSVCVAGPLDPTLVPADARWAAHLDMEAAVASKIGTHMRSTMPEELRKGLTRFSTDFGIDPFVDVRGVTVFGADGGESKGAAIALVSPAADKLAANLAKAQLKDFTSTTAGDCTIMSWTDHGREWHVGVTALNAETRAVAFADSRAELEMALKLVGAKRSGAVGLSLTLTDRKPRPGSLVFAAMRDVSSGSGETPRAQVLRAAKSVCVDLGEANVDGAPHIFADLTMLASTDADAVTMRDMFQGMIAMGRLGSRSDAELGKAMDRMAAAIKLGVEGQTFRLTADYASDSVIDMMKLVDAREKTGEANAAKVEDGGAAKKAAAPDPH